MPFRLWLVWTQGNFLRHVNPLLLLYKVTGDIVADNIPLMESMNRGFGFWCLLVVLLGKKGTNNLRIMCAIPPFSINYSFCLIPSGSLMNFCRRQSDTQSGFTFTHWTQNREPIVCVACVLSVCLYVTSEWHFSLPR